MTQHALNFKSVDCYKGYLFFAEEFVAARADLSKMVLFEWVVTQSPFILFIPLPFMLLPGFPPPLYAWLHIYFPQCISAI